MSTLSTLPKETFGGAAFGFLSYKLPLLSRHYARAFNELLQEGALGPGALPTGSLGVALNLLNSRKKQQEQSSDGVSVSASGKQLPEQVVLAGPSGLGKSSLIARLLRESSDRFDFSVSTTSRP